MLSEAVVADSRCSMTIRRNGGLIDVVVDGPGLHASTSVDAAHESREIATFFVGLAERWRGWSGERVFTSIEDELRIAATQDGHVRLELMLSQGIVLDSWSVQAVVTLEAGEQLSDAAVDVAAAVGD